MNNRLDYIKDFDNGSVEEMTAIRKEFMDLDNKLFQIWRDCHNPAGQRAASIARTQIEDGLHYAIKALCLKYEKKEVSNEL